MINCSLNHYWLFVCHRYLLLCVAKQQAYLQLHLYHFFPNNTVVANAISAWIIVQLATSFCFFSSSSFQLWRKVSFICHNDPEFSEHLKKKEIILNLGFINPASSVISFIPQTQGGHSLCDKAAILPKSVLTRLFNQSCCCALYHSTSHKNTMS